ncbi:transcriptional regulator NRG1 [Ceratobasidium sp. AG-Ba]|nr:transcriptional regulator NRG1 [Ceratobasidium sp. AG-Ba]
MSSISALLNVASASHSTNEHDLPSLTSLSNALLHSYSSNPEFVNNSHRYSSTSPACSPTHSRESNSPSASSQTSFSSYGPSYLPTPASSVRNLPVTNVSPSYTSGDNSFSYPSPRSETATVAPSYLPQNSSSIESSYSSYPYSMSRASTHAPMLSQPPSPALAGSTPLQQPTPPQHQAWTSMPPPPPPAQVDDKDQAKVDTTPAPALLVPLQLRLPKRPRRSMYARHALGHSRQADISRGILVSIPESEITSAHSQGVKPGVRDKTTYSNRVHATHPPGHPHPYPAPYPPHPHYATAPPYGAYPQHPPNGSPVYPGQPQFMAAPGQPMHYPYPPMSYAYPPPGPGQPPVHMQGAPQPPPGHAAVHNGHHPQYAPYPAQRTPNGQNGTAYTPQQSPHQTQQTMPPGQSAATSRAASTSGSNSPVQQSPRTAQAAPLPAANALGLQNGVNPPSIKPGQWNGQIDQNGSALGPDGRPQYANGAYAYPSPYPSETGSAQNLPAPLPPSQRPRGAGMPSPQSPGRSMNGNASGPPTPSTYAPQQVIQLEPTAHGQQADGRSPRPTLPPISYRSPQVPNGQYATGNVGQPGGPQLPQGKMPVSNTRGRAT